MSHSRKFTLPALAILALFCLNGLAQIQQQLKPCKHDDDQYEHGLDSYFANARGSSSSAVVLRVYGGLSPEYEIVIDPQVSSHTIFRYTPRKSIWGDAYDSLYPGKHRAQADYDARAMKVPVTKKLSEVPEAQVLDLMHQAKAIDTSICEHLPLRDSKGHEYVVKDAPRLEIIVDGGRTRASVTDTSGSKLLSQNPVLLQWALDLQKVSDTR